MFKEGVKRLSSLVCYLVDDINKGEEVAHKLLLSILAERNQVFDSLTEHLNKREYE